MGPPHSPKLSFVIPFMNEEATLEELYTRISDAVTPSLGPSETFEVIFIDDGSTDQSAAVAERLVKAHAQVSLLELQGNFGKSAALAAGFTRA